MIEIARYTQNVSLLSLGIRYLFHLYYPFLLYFPYVLYYLSVLYHLILLFSDGANLLLIQNWCDPSCS